MDTHTAHNKHKGVAHHQPGGTATFACMELVRYHKQKGEDFHSLGCWCSTAFYADPSHRTCIISAYNVGRHAPRGDSTIYQQQLRYIQNHGLDATPLRLFTVDFIAQLQVWQRQGDRLLVFYGYERAHTHRSCSMQTPCHWPAQSYALSMGGDGAAHIRLWFGAHQCSMVLSGPRSCFNFATLFPRGCR
jgi:hypothetical protein